jgi:hypothetical protein
MHFFRIFWGPFLNEQCHKILDSKFFQTKKIPQMAEYTFYEFHFWVSGVINAAGQIEKPIN